MYHVLKRVTDQAGHYYISVPPNALGYDSPEAVKEAAVTYATNHPQDRLVIVREVAHVSVEPVVKMLEDPSGLPAPTILHRLEHSGREASPVLALPELAVAIQEAKEAGPARDPQAKPRLLVLNDRRATPAELVGHLMVVAEGRIVKNAFGALELNDMPLSSSELLEVKQALGNRENT